MSGVTHAGLVVCRPDDGSVFLTQRSMDSTDDVATQQTWEFPGGGIEDGETPQTAAFREFHEETGLEVPPGEVVNTYTAPNGVYQAFIYVATEFPDIRNWVPTDEVQAVAWATPEQAQQMNLRPEMADFDWSLVSGNGETAMPEAASEPDFADACLMAGPIPCHGVLAPEGVETGDQRGFNEGAMTTRPLRLPLSWQKVSASGHDGSVVVGSVDRLMRKDGMIHWEGSFMVSSEASEAIDLVAFFGQFGVSVDGDSGSLDVSKSKQTGVTWFDAVRASGLTMCAIPAFAEAYVALGPHPDMPENDSPEADVLTASIEPTVAPEDAVCLHDGCAQTPEYAVSSSNPEIDGLYCGCHAAQHEGGALVGRRTEFGRGPGWATAPEATNRIHSYWTEKGQPGYEQVAWGTPGDFDRAKALIGEKIAKHSPEKMPFINQIIAQWHHDALGYWPATHAKMDRMGVKADAAGAKPAEASTEWEQVMVAAGAWDGSQSRFTLEQWKHSCALDRGGDGTTYEQYGLPIREPDGSLNADAVHAAASRFDQVDAPDAAKAAAKAKLRAAYGELNEPVPDVLTASAAYDVVLTASGCAALPPMDYFTRHPDTDALVIEDADANGIRRTYGYAAEWGVCHTGFDGRCVEAPSDPAGGTYPDFHLGRTKVATEHGPEYINTGLITYAKSHRSAKQILSEGPTQAHFDDVSHAWAAVALGEDDRGVWFSGVVLPHVEADDVTLIQASGQISGEWKSEYLRGLLSVNRPGFPVLRSSAVWDDDGEVLALVACAVGQGCQPSPAECMAALASVDAEVRFQKLREQYAGQAD